MKLIYEGHEGVELWDGTKPKPGDAVTVTEVQAVELLARDPHAWRYESTKKGAAAPAKEKV